MADNLLREAIAEAKQVKMAAVANAKLALEEAFKPHLASMLAATLRNESEGDAFEGINPSSTGIGTGDNKMPASDAKSSSNIPNPEQELDTYGDNPAGIDHTIGGTDPSPHGSDAHPIKLHDNFEFEVQDDSEEDGLPGEEDEENPFGADPEAEMGGEEEPVDGMGGGEEPELGLPGMGGEEEPVDGMGGDDDMDADDMGNGGVPMDGEGELDLDAIIRQLEKDVLGMEGGMETESDPGMGLAFEADNGTDTKGDPYNKVEPTDTTDMQTFGDGSTNPKPTNESEEMEEDVDLEEILREIDVNGPKRPDYYAKVATLQTENASLKRNLKEHRNVVKFLKDRISEINMLNAKLLFTNKLFKENSLNQGQKMQIVETFDRATTLREVKLIYTTLAQNFMSKPAPSRMVKQITEGLASKSIGSTKPKSSQVLTETDATVARFQKLAGILKS